MPLNAIKHPLIAHKIALLRQQGISTKQFRELANEVASVKELNLQFFQLQFHNFLCSELKLHTALPE